MATAMAPRLEWFPRPWTGLRGAARFLDLWPGAPATYAPGDERAGSGWHQDREQHLITPTGTADLFRRAAERLWRYDFYPPSLIEHLGVFEREGRRAAVGDDIVQRIHVAGARGWRLLDAVTLVRVSGVIAEPRRAGLAYVTTAAHFEIGEWSAWVEWAEAGALTVHIASVSRPGPRIALWQRPFTRALQTDAHRRGLERFARRAWLDSALT